MSRWSEPSVVARLVVDEAIARPLSDALAERLDSRDSAVAAFEEDGTWVIEIHCDRHADEIAVRSLVCELAGARLAERLVFATLAPRDWVATSLAGLAPVAAGRFVVHGAHDRSRVPPNRIGIEIEAALAFGTGHHGSTRGCLLALDRIVKTRRASRQDASGGRGRTCGDFGPCPSGSVIFDVGTGSGVLAIAAARTLPCKVLAGDIDPVSVRVAGANARLNRAGGRVAVIRANGVADGRFCAMAPFVIAFANILLNPLKRLAGPLVRHAAPGARIILSGLLPVHGNAALAAYRAHGLVLERRILIDGWLTLVLTRPAPKQSPSPSSAVIAAPAGTRSALRDCRPPPLRRRRY
jgi:ribosomal protein L11 methyltransferase